jgi:hypothetical protein
MNPKASLSSNGNVDEIMKQAENHVKALQLSMKQREQLQAYPGFEKKSQDFKKKYSGPLANFTAVTEN